MRKDWDETGGLPLAAAHRHHRQTALDFGFTSVGSDTLRENMQAVVRRAHEQGAGEPR
jgi:hypothetical protein